MGMKDALLPEFDHETGTTRRLLERVPEDKLAWQPHQKSMSLGRLAMHLAEVPAWGAMTISQTETVFNTGDYKARTGESRAEILAVFDEGVAATRKALAQASDAELLVTWTLKSDGKTVFSMPRIGVLRGMVMNHMIHHRAQLSVYLRMNDVPLPAMYGPSADEQA